MTDGHWTEAKEGNIPYRLSTFHIATQMGSLYGILIKGGRTRWWGARLYAWWGSVCYRMFRGEGQGHRGDQNCQEKWQIGSVARR